MDTLSRVRTDVPWTVSTTRGYPMHMEVSGLFSGGIPEFSYNLHCHFKITLSKYNSPVSKNCTTFRRTYPNFGRGGKKRQIFIQKVPHIYIAPNVNETSSPA